MEILANALISVGIVAAFAALAIIVRNGLRDTDALAVLVACADRTSRRQPGWRTEVNADGETYCGMLYRGADANLLIADRDHLFLSKDREPRILARYERFETHKVDRETFRVVAHKADSLRFAEKLALSFPAGRR